MLVILSTVYSHSNADNLSCYNAKTVSADLVVTDITYQSDKFSSAEVEILNSKQLKRGTKLSVTYNDNNIKMGDRITSELKLEDLSQNEYKSLYYSKEIYITATLGEIEKIKSSHDFVLTKIGKLREYIKTTLFSKLKFSNAATVTALIVGDDSYFTNEFDFLVKASGVSHVMVVSGMHLTILVVLVTKLVEKLFPGIEMPVLQCPQ